MEIIDHGRRVRRVRHELKRRDVVVAATERVGDGFVRITFGGESLADFVSEGFDDHVKFIWTDATGALVRRDYTPRRFDTARRELTIDFAVHGGGAASDWARRARVGDRATIGGPKGSMIVPTDFDWHLLVGDETALPAIDRRLGELPAGTSAFVVLLVADADRRTFATPADVRIQWVATPDALVGAVRALSPPLGDGYAWAAGEAATMARVRDVLVGERGHPREALRVAAYWKRGASDFHEDLAR